ncbi:MULTISPECIES: ScbR family autoregulator-binding transcription factor [unclassified Streptomyces]|uniref:ScbR family autoregulator-binding transcription factor n=1 Tax=unclassified Streptomyces TaxID=2593676 RepID=UPI0022552129|nr:MULTISPECIES: ScbR family autoregulator-binding transcription factor [unclassified Streptomyces]MCX4526366.1 ScbR family autoregulator-binding transcription factor [Streptomyces sp. NBC_01551]MCX4543072.1 ScbR family autoregulator-binding transcription factor [Streptomyces sp. NBC_01565]
MARQHRALRTRQELIRSAAEAFDRVGYGEASIATISSRAGVSNGALHFHFKNKKALGEAVELVAAQVLLHVTGQVPLRHPAPLQLLIDTSHTLARTLRDDPVLRAGFGLGCDRTWHSVVNLWEHWQDWVQLMLTVARDQGSLEPGVAIEDAVFTIAAVCAGFDVLNRTGVEWEARRAVTRFWRLMLPQLSTEAAREHLSPEGSGAAACARGEGWSGYRDMAGICGNPAYC